MGKKIALFVLFGNALLLTSVDAQSLCSSSGYTCDNGECSFFNIRCDGDCDCSDCSDERRCFSCPSGYPCRNRQCISISSRCNRRSDCSDGSDEENCGFSSEECIDGSARLVPLTSTGSNSFSASNAGRFEICVGNKYGTVQVEDSSFSYWSEKNALVACKQLGFAGALNTIPSARLSSDNYASFSVPVHYRAVSCLGTESSISRCSRQFTTTSTHISDVFLVCWPSNSIYNELHYNVSNSSYTIGSIRLVGERADGKGAVEILTEIGWSSICPDAAWTDDVATDICQYLGYDIGTSRMLTLSSPAVSPRLVQDPLCLSVRQNATGERVAAGFCTFTRSTSSSCAESEGTYAAVTCTIEYPRSSRLFGVDIINSTRVQGIVEYQVNGRWGVMCKPSLRSRSEVAGSICEGFGYDRKEATLISLNLSRIQMIESRMKPLWVRDLRCDSFDRSLSRCTIALPLGYGTCGSSRDILVVDCGPKRGFNSGYIAAIVVPIVMVAGLVLIIVVILCKVLKCLCWSPSSQSVLPVTTTQELSLTPSSAPAPRSEPDPLSESREATAPRGESSTDPESTVHKSELSEPPPPSYVSSFNLPNPKEDLPPPYLAPMAVPSAPSPVAYPIAQGNSVYPPANPANSNDITPYPTAPYP